MLPAQVPFDPAARLYDALSPGAKNFLKAATICGISKEAEVARAAVAKQMQSEYSSEAGKFAQELLSTDPPVLRRGQGPRYRLTPFGAKVILAATPVEETEEVEEPPWRITSQGLRNRQMQEYAESVSGEFWLGDYTMCSFCPHHELQGVRKGGKRLCVNCFAKGKRPF